MYMRKLYLSPNNTMSQLTQEAGDKLLLINLVLGNIFKFTQSQLSRSRIPFHKLDWECQFINTLTSPISDANNSIAIVNDVNLTANFSLSNYNISVVLPPEMAMLREALFYYKRLSSVKCCNQRDGILVIGAEMYFA